jgi:RND family efflux transporter MFP subunit
LRHRPPVRTPIARRAQALTRLLLGFGLAATTGCGDDPAPAGELVRPVKIVEVASRSGATREYPGRIRAARYAEIGFEVPGRIVELPAREGERVQNGQVLARLDARDYQNALASAEAKLRHAATEAERARTLVDKNVKPRSELDRAQRQVAVHRADVAQARKAVEDAVLRAPFAGVVARKLVTDFRNVQAKEKILVVQDDSRLEIKVSVPERDLTAGGGPRRSLEELTERIRPRVVVDAASQREFPARLTELSEVADPTTRTFEATLAFDQPEAVNVMGGMTAKLRIDVPASEPDAGLSLPASSVVSDSSDAPFVWVVDPSTMQVSRRTVSVGELAGSQIRVESGLSAGDWVVVSGVHQLRDAMTVRRLEN